METIEHVYVETNGIKLHVAQQGPEDGELVLLLHGFPEFWYGWHHQMADLAEKGYRVWAPDQRGYNLSDKPEKVNEYTLSYLVEDIVGLIKQSGKEKVFLVGHDWGGIVAWQVAQEYPELINKLIILNAPHLSAMSKHVLKHPSQLLKSSYILFFQLKKIPEEIFSQSDWELATEAMQSTGRERAFSEADMVEYRSAWSQPKAMKSMINWYRANLSSFTSPKGTDTVAVPTYIIWGTKDQFLGQELAEKSLEFCEDGQGILLGESTHWVHHEEPEHVSRLIFNFINETKQIKRKESRSRIG